jgi:hypothetical protein
MRNESTIQKRIIIIREDKIKEIIRIRTIDRIIETIGIKTKKMNKTIDRVIGTIRIKTKKMDKILDKTEEIIENKTKIIIKMEENNEEKDMLKKKNNLFHI